MCAAQNTTSDTNEINQTDKLQPADRAFENTKRMSALFDSDDIGIVIKDENNVILGWNLGSKNILGYSEDEIVGKYSNVITTGESIADLDKVYANLRKGKTCPNIYANLRAKSGKIIHARNSYVPTFDNGRFTGMIIIFRDVTAEMHAKEKLHDLAAIFSVPGTGIMLKDKNDVITDWNIGAYNILGYSVEEAVGNTPALFATEEFKDEYITINKRVLAGDFKANAEVPRRHKSGRNIVCLASYSPIVDSAGAVVGSTVIFHEITEKKRLERELKELYDNTAAIIRELPAPICVLRKKDKTILEANTALADSFFPNTRQGLIGKSVLPFIIENSALSKRQFVENMDNGVDFTGTIMTDDGKQVEVQIMPRHLMYHGQEALLLHCTDLTSHRQKEKALLDAAVAAKEASDMKSSFIANMSHEIRTPLNGVIGFANLALDDETMSDKTREYISKIKISTDALLSVVGDILDISKIESGRMEVEKTPFSLHDIFTQCESIMGAKAKEKGICLYFYSEPYIKQCLVGDPTKLRQVLLNLLANAIKFTHKGIVKLMSIAEHIDDTHIKVFFEVKDSGIGMSEQQLSQIFQPFVQADSSTTRKYGGTGLGVTIAKNMIELMGGELKVESLIKVGSRFSFELTFEAAEKLTCELDTQNRQIPEKLMRPTFSGEILVCEDNELNQEVITEHLLKVGLNSVVARNGLEGFNLVKQRMLDGKPFDLILMDIHMPVLDGLEATDRIIKSGCETPVVAMTANAMSNDVGIYLSQGLSNYIGKPFAPEELWSCLAQYLTPIAWSPVTVIKRNASASDESGGGSGQIIDKDLGLKRLSYDEALYSRLIYGFLKSNRTTYTEFENALSDGNDRLAARIVHTLKSTASSIGALALMKSASECERMVTDSNITIEAKRKLKADLEAVLGELTRICAAGPTLGALTPAETNPDMDIDAALELVGLLEPLLQVGDLESIALCGKIHGFLSPLGEPVKTLLTQIEDFDFDTASETLAHIKSVLSRRQES